MKFLILLFITVNAFAHDSGIIHVEGPLSRGRPWMDFTSSAELNLKKLFELLERSPTGGRLLNETRYKASQSGLTLLDVIKVGDSSLTDTTLVRKFNPSSPEHVVFETRSVVYINRGLAWDHAILDLAHELTHYLYRESFNPYGESFNARDFIKGTIEGSGGEAQAFVTECKVSRELFTKSTQCNKILDGNNQVSLPRAIDLFYNVGSYHNGLRQKLLDRKIAGAFPSLKDEKPDFISSAYGVPYPVAALMEYDLVLSKVCENDKKRLAYMKQGRAPASADQEKFQKNYYSRCNAL